LIRLRDAASGAQLGTISEAQLEFLMQQLEEETAADQDYYIDADTVDLLEEAGADEDLLGVLRAALGDEEGVEIAWSPA
jgi:hypothetical protein